jgi:hypothetical protein
VTKVEEWTKAETGVGAAIAKGSQEEKGYWALLVKAPNIIKQQTQKVPPSITEIFQWPLLIKSPIDKISPTSPKRLVKTVISPAPSE